MATPPKAKPHRCWTEAPGHPAGGRAGLEGRARGSLHLGSPADFRAPPPAHLHLKSQEPAARSTLLGCQSRLRTVERMGFLMCLHTHLDTRTGRGEGDRHSQHPRPQCPRDSTFPWSPADPLGSPEGGAWALLAHGPLRA